jgi:Uma2 family endonuclease
MNGMTTGALMTADEYFAGPEDGPRTQLIEGELVLVEPTWLHQMVCGDLEAALRAWSREQPGRGVAIRPVDVKLNERNVYNPDVLWYAADRAPQRTDPRPYPMPNIAIEVRSPSTWRFDIGTKKRVYQQRGLRELWLVDTSASSVLIFRRSRPDAPIFDVVLELERDDQLTSPQLPGFSLAPSELFSDG